ncbi:hypothetical protein AB0O99_14700 [Cellulosimicrobium funkei]|uniref:hypothetical protein n=1 Tax=Cellulosimicrobium funkei TaxID=264251 RepID=UPI00344837CF
MSVVARPGRLRQSLPAVLTPLVTVLLGVVAAWRGNDFFYDGDAPESFVPLWHHFGEQLRAGVWPQMDPAGWMGGNYAAEAAYSQWNPVILGNYVLTSFFDDLALAGAVVAIEMLVLLAVCTYLLARSYGAGSWPAFAVATALPVSGFTLFYEAAGWPAGLAAFVGVTAFWWVAHRQVTRGGSPLFTFVVGFLAMTTGNPYAALGLVVVLAALGVELLIARRWQGLVSLVVTGALVGMTAWLVFGPLLGTQDVTSRQELARIANDTFMVPDLGDIAGSSTASYLPSITNWGGALVEQLPSVYLAWFVLPLLPWLRWGALGARLRTAPSLAVFGLVFAVMALGPSNFWLFRWPLRVIEYLYLGVLVGLAVALTAGLATSHARARALGSLSLVLLGAYLAFAVRPEDQLRHVAVLVVTLGLVALALRVGRRSTEQLAGVLAAGTLVFTFFQTSVFPSDGNLGTYPPSSVSAIRAQADGFRGTVLQLAKQGQATSESIESAQVLFGNLPVVSGHESVNRYTGIGYRDFANALCIDYKGSVCPEALEKALRPVRGTEGNLLDALRVETLVLQQTQFEEQIADGPPDGWRVVEEDDERAVWERIDPLTLPGRVSGTTGDLEVTSSDSSFATETVSVSGSGTLTFARLAWPGYTATADGDEIPMKVSPEGLLQVDVPDGADQVTVQYTTPAVRSGAILAGLALVLALGQSVALGMVRRRRRVAPSSVPS